MLRHVQVFNNNRKDFPDLGFVIAGGTDGSLYKWVYGRQTLTKYTIHTKWINMMIRIQNTNQILTASYDFTCKRIDVTSMTLIGTFTGHTSIVTSVQFFNSTTAISVGNDKTVRIWDIDTMVQLDSFITNHTANVNGAIYFKKLSYIVTASVDKSIMIWNYGDKTLAKAINGAHTNDINLIQKIQYNVFVSGSTDTTIKVWNLATLSLIRTISSHTGSINAFGHQSKSQLFLSGSSDMTVQYQSINNCLADQYFLNQCEQCSSKCLTCYEHDTYCLTCNIQRQNAPQCSCVDGYYEDSQTCQLCAFQCLTCASQTECTSCRGDRQGISCTCLIGYDDGVSQNCYQCISNCNQCDQSGCLQCTSIRVIPQCQCPDGYYEESVCQQCQFKCQTCQNLQSCTKCKGDRVGADCVCPSYKYDDGINVLCQDCIQYCSICNGINCQQCDTNRIFDGQDCICEQGYYESNGSCKQCKLNCLTCNSLKCLSCATLRSGDQCNCNDGYYELNNNCLKCNNMCKSCLDSSSCITCQSNKQPPLCLCELGYELQNQQCQICQQNCLQCDINLICIKCSENRVSPNCNCADGYFEDNNLCNKCQYPCQSCNKDGCLSCSNSQSPPLCQCNEGYFDNGQDCIQCSNNCIKCTSIDTCLECLDIRVAPQCICPDKYFDDGQCIQCLPMCSLCKNSLDCIKCLDSKKNPPDCLCDQGFYYDKTNKLCIGCSSNCLSCNEDNCLTCDINRGAPKCDCNQGYYEQNNQCVKCSFQCLDCNKSQCLTCIDAYRQLPDCSCPPSMYEVDNQCIQCSPNCQTCNSQGCLSCANQLSIQTNCLCLSSQYLNEGSCIDCPLNCLVCNQNACEKCAAGYQISENMCIEDPICNQHCIDCTYQGCLQCSVNRIVPDCSCQVGYYGSNCNSCINNCISCTSQVCDKCQDGYEGSWCTKIPQQTLITRPYDQTQVVPIILILSDLIIFVGLAYVGWKMDRPTNRTKQKQNFQTIETQRSNKISDQKVTESTGVMNEKILNVGDTQILNKINYKTKLPPLQNAPKLNKKIQNSFILSLFKNKPQIQQKDENKVQARDQTDILDIEEVNQEITSPQNFLNTIDNKHNFILNLDFGGNRSPLPPQTKKNEFKNISVYQVEPEPELSLRTKIKLILQKHLLLKIFLIKGMPRYMRIMRQYSYQLLIGVITGYMALYENFLVRLCIGLVILLICRIILHYCDIKCWKVELVTRYIILITALSYRFSIKVDFTQDFLIVFSIDFFILQLFLGTLL